jgi:lycopene beta-cyclase
VSQFDYIITGGGAAGLSLAYHLDQAGLHDRQILIIEQDAKQRNDRTWCFWEVGAGPFEALVARSWKQIWFHGERYSERIAIDPYEYKMIQGGDFYRFMHDWIATRPNITRLQGRVERIAEAPGGVAVQVDGREVRGNWAFNSIYCPAPRPPGHTYWLQHFKGWVITTSQPVFDPDAATFMDFRVEQQNDVRFVYVLPYDERTALVEYTLFSPELEPQEVYDTGLKRYISQQLGVESYAIQHVEYGVIPMTDIPFQRRPSPHVMNIGTAGGMTKASTGYTFQRIQRQSARIAASLRQTGQPFYPEPPLSRHAWMDSVLLHVLDEGLEQGRTFFEQLFSRNAPQRVLRFLDEETTLLEEFALMATVNVFAFLCASWNVTRRRAEGMLASMLAASRT